MPQFSDTLFAEAAARNIRAVVFWKNDQAEFPHNHPCAFSEHRLKRYRSFLGTEHPSLLIDFTETFHADALLALAGTLTGGGTLVLKVPEQPGPALNRLQRFCQSAFSECAFNKAPSNHGENVTDLSVMCQTVTEISPDLSSFLNRAGSSARSSDRNESGAEFTLTDDQAAAFKQLKTSQAKVNGRSAYLLNAPRGRGKSSLVGYWLQSEASAAHSADNDVRYIVCAPSKRQASALIEHAEGAKFEFIPPDQLASLNHLTKADWLIIDEAASLPAHILRSVQELPCNLLAATTTEGYESSGRNYALRFQQELADYFDHVNVLKLESPVRWAPDDPLERALNQCFFLQSSEALGTSSSQIKAQAREPFTTPPTPSPKSQQQQSRGTESVPQAADYTMVHASELEEDQLAQCFQLLMEAHYQTSPNDLKLLLDDSQQKLFVQWANQAVTGVIWFDDESAPDRELINNIYQGKRRPPGNLLTQSLIYFLRLKEAGTLNTARIVRIAVTPELQGRGLGTALLREFVSFARNEHFDLAGTSFGVNAQLASFWQQNDFECIRFGQRRDPASGYFSATYVRPLSAESKRIVSPFSELFMTCCRLSPHFSQYPTEVIKAVIDNQHATALSDASKQSADNRKLRIYCQTLIQDYISGFIEFTHMRIFVAAGMEAGVIEIQDSLLKTCICRPDSLQELAKELGYEGKKKLAESLHEICTRELHSI